MRPNRSITVAGSFVIKKSWNLPGCLQFLYAIYTSTGSAGDFISVEGVPAEAIKVASHQDCFLCRALVLKRGELHLTRLLSEDPLSQSAVKTVVVAVFLRPDGRTTPFSASLLRSLLHPSFSFALENFNIPMRSYFIHITSVQQTPRASQLTSWRKDHARIEFCHLLSEDAVYETCVERFRVRQSSSHFTQSDLKGIRLTSGATNSQHSSKRHSNLILCRGVEQAQPAGSLVEHLRRVKRQRV